MPRVPQKPAQGLTNEQIEAFWRDGVICIRNLYSPDWVDRLREALDKLSLTPSPIFGEPRPGEDFHGIYAWFTDDIIRDFVLQGSECLDRPAGVSIKACEFFLRSDIHQAQTFAQSHAVASRLHVLAARG